jgi:hypothetical protein
VTAALHEAKGWRVRVASRDDNDALCALLADVAMPGAVALAQDRRPDFFALGDAFGGPMETYVAEDEAGQLLACGSVLVRDAWMPDGERGRIGYICDLRARPEHRGARILPELGRAALEHARDAHGVTLHQCALVDDNRRVVRAALERPAARGRQPLTRPMTRYAMVALQGRLRDDPHVETASSDDLDELATFLAQRASERTLGEPFDRKRLEARLAAWPGLRPESFHLVREARGAIVACCAPWAAMPLRRLRVAGYAGWMRPYRRAHDAVSRMTGAPALPAPGEAFRFATLSHLEVVDDDPRRLARLLRAASARTRERRLHFLAAMVPDGSPLRRAFRGRLATGTRMTLCTTALPDSPWAQAPPIESTRPGFEMALA